MSVLRRLVWLGFLLAGAAGCDTPSFEGWFGEDMDTWRPPKTARPDAGRRLDVARALQKAGLFSLALSEYESLVEDPSSTSAEAEIGRAACLLRAGNEADGLRAYREFAARHGDRARPALLALFEHYRHAWNWAEVKALGTGLLVENLSEAERRGVSDALALAHSQLALRSVVGVSFGEMPSDDWMFSDPSLVRLDRAKGRLEVEAGRGEDLAILPVPHAGGPFLLSLEVNVPRLEPGAAFHIGLGGLRAQQLPDLGTARTLPLGETVRTSLVPDAHLLWIFEADPSGSGQRLSVQFGTRTRFERVPLCGIFADRHYLLEAEYVPGLSKLLARVSDLDGYQSNIYLRREIPRAPGASMTPEAGRGGRGRPLQRIFPFSDAFQDLATFAGFFPSRRKGDGWATVVRLGLQLPPERVQPLPLLPEGLRRYYGACHAIVRGDPAAASRLLDQAAPLVPELADIFLQRGAVRLALGDPRGAASDFLLVLHEIPSSQPHLALAETQLSKSRAWVSLLDILERHRALVPTFRVTPYQDDVLLDLDRHPDLELQPLDLPERARILLQLGKSLSAEDDSDRRAKGRGLFLRGLDLCNARILLDPKNAQVLLLRARMHRELSNDSMAQLDYVRAKSLDENEPEVYMGLGSLLLEHGQYEQATTPLSRGVELAPQKPDAYWLRGLAWMGRKRWEEARRDFETLLTLEPRSLRAHTKLREIPEPVMPRERIRYHDEWVRRLGGAGKLPEEGRR